MRASKVVVRKMIRPNCLSEGEGNIGKSDSDTDGDRDNDSGSESDTRIKWMRYGYQGVMLYDWLIGVVIVFEEWSDLVSLSPPLSLFGWPFFPFVFFSLSFHRELIQLTALLIVWRESNSHTYTQSTRLGSDFSQYNKSSSTTRVTWIVVPGWSIWSKSWKSRIVCRRCMKIAEHENLNNNEISPTSHCENVE